MPTITLVLPTYKRPQLLARAIESARSQSWKELCVVVRDNCSCDETEAVASEIEKLDPRIKYTKNKFNIGAHENIRQGIRNIETDYFAILSDDDFLEPNFFSEAMSLFEQYPKAGFIAFRVDIVNLSGDVIGTNYPRYKEADKVASRFYDPEDGFDGYMNNLFPCTWTGYVFRKEISLALDLEDYAEVGPGADIRFIWRSASRFPFVVTNIKGANFTSHSESFSASVNMFDERFLYWLKQRFMAIKNDSQVSLAIRSKISKYYSSKSNGSLGWIKYYAMGSASTIARRAKAGQYEELEFEFYSMKNFLPWTLLYFIRIFVVIVIYLKLENVVRFLLRLPRINFKSK